MVAKQLQANRLYFEALKYIQYKQTVTELTTKAYLCNEYDKSSWWLRIGGSN